MLGFLPFFAVILTIIFFSVRDAILYKYNAFFISVGTVEFIQVRIFFPIYGTIKAVSVQQLSS